MLLRGFERVMSTASLDAGLLTPVASAVVVQFFKHWPRSLVKLDQAAFRELLG